MLFIVSTVKKESQKSSMSVHAVFLDGSRLASQVGSERYVRFGCCSRRLLAALGFSTLRKSPLSRVAMGEA